MEFPYRLKSFELKHFMFYQIEQPNRILRCAWNFALFAFKTHPSLWRRLRYSVRVGGAGKFDREKKTTFIEMRLGTCIRMNANRRFKRFHVFFFGLPSRIWHMWRLTAKLFRREWITKKKRKNHKVVAKRSFFLIFEENHAYSASRFHRY